MSDQAKVRPFSNGEEFRRWTAKNCEKCRKQWDGGLPENSNCDIEQELAIACIGDGEIPAGVWERAGKGKALCTEMEWLPPYDIPDTHSNSITEVVVTLSKVQEHIKIVDGKKRLVF